MIVRNANQINWKPLELSYMHDSDLSFKVHYEYFDEGFNFAINTALHDTQDVSVNKHMNFYLTDTHKLPDIAEIKPPLIEYPKMQTTHLEFRQFVGGIISDNWFLSVKDPHDIFGDCRVETSITGNNNYFEIIFLDATYCKVRHFNGKIIQTLTHHPDSRTNFYFEPDYRQEVYATNCDPQTFIYFLDPGNNTILLCKRIQDAEDNWYPYCIVPSFNVDNQQYRLKAEPMSDAMTNIEQRVWHMRPQVQLPTTLDLKTIWTSYTTDLESNSLNVSKSRSFDNISNNFLMMSYTSKLSSQWPKYLPEIETCLPGRNIGSLPVDILPLKNQLTIENKLGRDNVFDTEDGVNHRIYHGLHTGTNQEHGFDSIYLSYAAGTTELLLPTDKVTYFHFPTIAYPYDKLNVNDSKLILAGAIASNTPLKADKVFKRRSADNNIEEFVDEDNGTWLCAWLSGSDNPSVFPLWVDRYYHPNYFTKSQALCAVNTVQKTEYDEALEALPAGSEYVHGPFFDKISNLTFEPGVLYAYHHIGCHDLNNIVKSFDRNILVKDVETYEDLDHVKCCTTSTEYCGDNILTYEFDSDRYGLTNSPNSKGSFTLTFDLHSDDWQKPFCHSAIGNYDNDGFSIYNEEDVTPFIVLPQGSYVTVYNTTFDILHSFQIIDTNGKPRNIQSLVKKEGTNSFWLLDEDNVIHEYDMEGIERNRIAEHSLVSTQVAITDFDVDENNNIYLLQTPGLSGKYIKLTATLSGHDMSCEEVSVPDVPAAMPVKCNEYGVFKPKIDPTTGYISGYEYPPYVTAIDDALLKNITARIFVVRGKPKVVLHDVNLPQGVTVDSKGNFYFVYNNILYWSSDPSTIKGTPIAIPRYETGFRNAIDAINCDKHGNLWVLYTSEGKKKLSKFHFRDETTNASEILLTVDIPNLEGSVFKYIEFTYEFTTNGYDEGILLFDRNENGDTVIRVDMETGKIITTYDLDTKSVKMSLQPTVAKTPRWGINPTTNTSTGSITGWNYTHNDTSLSAYDAWPECGGNPVEEDGMRRLMFGFSVDNPDMYTIEFYGDNRVEGYLNASYMGLYERSDATSIPVKYIRTLDVGHHVLRFDVFNTKGTSYEDNPLTLSFVIKNAGGKIILTSKSLDDSNILLLGNNPCSNYYSLNEGLRSWKDITGSTYYRTSVAPETPGRHLRVKLKSKNLYSGFLTKAQNSTFYLDWNIPKDIKPGSHYISVVYNAEGGSAQLYVDGELQDEKDIQRGRYAFNEMLSKPLFVGSTAYFNSSPLFKALRWPGYYLASGMKVTDLRLYDTPLNYFDIQSHMARLLKIRDMKWNLPTGQRNFIDTIERMFKLKTQDRKSTHFNLKILNSFVDNPAMKAEIDKAVREYITYVTPLQTVVNTIDWRTDATDETNPLKTITPTIIGQPKGGY